MADGCFEHPRLAAIYDLLEPERPDLDPYLAMAPEFGARSVLDIGCGTGTLACMLAGRGFAVVAVDPASSSLDVARRKPHAHQVRWLEGDATTRPSVQVDLVTLTGNVAQVFLTDDEWERWASSSGPSSSRRACRWCHSASTSSSRSTARPDLELDAPLPELRGGR